MRNQFGTRSAAVAAGLAGCSIEDYSAGLEPEIHDIGRAAERVAAAAEAPRAGRGLVLTARAENFIRGNPDLANTIARLQAYQEAGAEVLYAPGLVDLADIRSVVSSVDRPVNVLLRPGIAPVAELAEAGVARISVGGVERGRFRGGGPRGPRAAGARHVRLPRPRGERASSRPGLSTGTDDCGEWITRHADE